MKDIRYRILQQVDGDIYINHSEFTTMSDAQNMLYALEYSGIPNLLIREHTIEKNIKVFEISLSPIHFSLC